MKKLIFGTFLLIFSLSVFAQQQNSSIQIRGTRAGSPDVYYVNGKKARTKQVQAIKVDEQTSFIKDKLPQNAFVFYVIGDWGRQGSNAQQSVANAMNKCAHEAKPEFIISTGDNFYFFGVRSINDVLWKKSFEDVYNGDAIKDITWYPVLGNHDTYGREKAEIEYTQVNPRWQMPSEYFAKEFGDATFVFTNTEHLVHRKSVAQWNFIDSTLAAAKTKWKFVVGHHPIYSSNPMHGNSSALVGKLKPMLEKYGVQAYIAGHDHDLQHQQPKGSPIDYFVSGAGSELRNTGINENTKFAQSENGFMIVALKENTMYVYFIDKDSNVIYSYTKTL